MRNEFDFVKATMDTPRGNATYYELSAKKLGHDLSSLPYSIRILLENSLRFSGRVLGSTEAVHLLSEWPKSIGQDLPFMPSRVLLQDYTGVPLIVDLAAMRSAGAKLGINPSSVNSQVPVDLVIDHSIQVDAWGNPSSIQFNLEKEFERNSERYSLLKWSQTSFDRMRVFPPGKGICHQFNLEYLASVVALDQKDGQLIAYPDTLVGTDSHTTMVNGLGVLGWGVGGIEAEAVMLGEPYSFTIPKVVGVKFTGELPEGSTPTDLVLTVTEVLRKENVVDAFVEYFGDTYSELSVPDRATIGNMSPEYGATVGFSPVDDSTIKYLLGTGRDSAYVNFVRKYCEIQGLYLHESSPEPNYSRVVQIDLSQVEPSIAGPRNPDERISLRSARKTILMLLEEFRKKSNRVGATTHSNDDLSDGSVVIAAITSCTNTSNPTVMLGAGLLAEKAVKLGLRPKPYVKRSMAPGSNVVKDYLARTELLPFLEKLGFNIVGYGCTTCIGNSGPLQAEVEKSIRDNDIYAVAVLSGNRNFDGRIHPLARGSFLMSPPLVVAYALAGRIDIDFYKEPIGSATDGREVYLKDLWPQMSEIKKLETEALSPEIYRKRYSHAQEGDEKWTTMNVPSGEVYVWDEKSTYIREPPWFEQSSMVNREIKGAKILAIFGDKVTTDHISPAGAIAKDSPAAAYLIDQGVPPNMFSSYGARRGNHEVMVRGGFSNIRLKNLLAKGKEGGWTTYLPSGELMSIYDAALRYRTEKIPLIIIAGKQYGAGSSRDWAAKATLMLGVKAVIAESYERIHRSNLIAMGVLPLEFSEGTNATSLGLNGTETYDIAGIDSMKGVKPKLTVSVHSASGHVTFGVVARLDNEMEIEYYRSGGILPYVFRKMSRTGG
ncbi:MAG TPA: aconitate hydratase AcnA [Methylomirabilota bacterium]|nr:aconitate hydratase AcnA [Methylomirabilota bacterium]